MPNSTVFMILACLHLLICVLMYVAMRFGVIRVRTQIMPVVVFVPLWGAICVLLLHFLNAFGLEGTVEAGVEKLHTNEDAYRSLLVEDLNIQKSVVPLQEALILNDAKMRRGMMLDVLYENPGDYYELLDEAISNEDGEVVHYATTAMAELAKEYDFSLQQMEKAYADNPNDSKTLNNYCDFLGGYLSRNLVQGQMERVQRRQYAQLLTRRAELEPTIVNYDLLAGTWMKLEEFALAGAVIEEMERRWPCEELTIMVSLEYAVRHNDGRRINEIVRLVENGGIYLSVQNRQKLSFFAEKAKH